MNKKLWSVSAVVLTLAMAAVGASAQMAEVKEKPRMYTYVAFWDLARAQWADEEKLVLSEQKFMDKGVADGVIVGYGSDQNLIHEPDGPTHDTWFSAMSMAGLLNVLDQLYKSNLVTSPVQSSAIKHSDALFVSRFYNWHAGSWKDVYSQTAMYKLKADAPDDAVDILAKTVIVPLLEKALADGSIHEYEVDTEAIHTEAPGTFWISYVAANAEGLDKVSAAVREASKANPLRGPAFGAMVDFTAHRDYLVRTNATYK
ncbi:MAG TPA: hypothetical protein VI386_06570 [Candidatus Sulfotelmatobacter sp.]